MTAPNRRRRRLPWWSNPSHLKRERGKWQRYKACIASLTFMADYANTAGEQGPAFIGSALDSMALTMAESWGPHSGTM